MSSKSDSELYTNFKFCEEKNHRRWINKLIYRSKQFMMKKNSNISIHIIVDSASVVQVGDIEQTIV